MFQVEPSARHNAWMPTFALLGITYSFQSAGGDSTPSLCCYFNLFRLPMFVIRESFFFMNAMARRVEMGGRMSTSRVAWLPRYCTGIYGGQIVTLLRNILSPVCFLWILSNEPCKVYMWIVVLGHPVCPMQQLNENTDIGTTCCLF